MLRQQHDVTKLKQMMSQFYELQQQLSFIL